MKRLTEWGVQNGPIKKNRVLPTILFFWKFEYKNLFKIVYLMYQVLKYPY